MKSILCKVCNRPISCTNGTYNFRFHFSVKHPNVKVPYGFEKVTFTQSQSRSVKRGLKKLSSNDKVQCKYCRKMITSGNLKRHLSEVHGLKKIDCPSKDCTFGAKRLIALRQHWIRQHPTLRFPEIRSGSIFTYQTALSLGNTNQENVS